MLWYLKFKFSFWSKEVFCSLMDALWWKKERFVYFLQIIFFHEASPGAIFFLQPWIAKMLKISKIFVKTNWIGIPRIVKSVLVEEERRASAGKKKSSVCWKEIRGKHSSSSVHWEPQNHEFKPSCYQEACNFSPWKTGCDFVISCLNGTRRISFILSDSLSHLMVCAMMSSSQRNCKITTKKSFPDLLDYLAIQDCETKFASASGKVCITSCN